MTSLYYFYHSGCQHWFCHTHEVVVQVVDGSVGQQTVRHHAETTAAGKNGKCKF
jgi:hypothetical protein